MNSYVSNVLCHFVGRSLKTDDDRFDLLVRIIKEGQLKANLEKPNSPSTSSTWTYSGERLGEIFQQCDCVCFCDTRIICWEYIPRNTANSEWDSISRY